jgi:hypothetical protein
MTKDPWLGCSEITNLFLGRNVVNIHDCSGSTDHRENAASQDIDRNPGSIDQTHFAISQQKRHPNYIRQSALH